MTHWGSAPVTITALPTTYSPVSAVKGIFSCPFESSSSFNVQVQRIKIRLVKGGTAKSRTQNSRMGPWPHAMRCELPNISVSAAAAGRPTLRPRASPAPRAGRGGRGRVRGPGRFPQAGARRIFLNALLKAALSARNYTECLQCERRDSLYLLLAKYSRCDMGGAGATPIRKCHASGPRPVRMWGRQAQRRVSFQIVRRALCCREAR